MNELVAKELLEFKFDEAYEEIADEFMGDTKQILVRDYHIATVQAECVKVLEELLSKGMLDLETNIKSVDVGVIKDLLAKLKEVE